jgi:hypothetical protein
MPPLHRSGVSTTISHSTEESSSLSKKEAQAKPDARSRRRAENRRQALIWNGIVLGTLGVFLALVAWYIYVNLRPGPVAGEQVFADEGHAHLTEGVALPAFQHEPPLSGTHYDRAAEWGATTTPVPVGIYLHNLGIGGVVFLYHCATPCPDLEKQLSTFYQEAPTDSLTGLRKILITPYDKELPATIVALAWDHQLNLTQFDKGQMLLWYKRFVNQGPEPSR